MIFSQPAGTLDQQLHSSPTRRSSDLNSGTINNNQSTINVGGSVTTAGLGTFTRTGGTIKHRTSTHNNATHAAIRVGAARLQGSWNLTMSARINGGSVAAASGSALVVV